MQEYSLKTGSNRFDQIFIYETVENAKSAAKQENKPADEQRQLWEEIRNCYSSRRENNMGVNMLEPLVLSGQVRVSFVVSLLADLHGYTVSLASKNGSEPESVSLPYEDGELLEYLDAEQIPPVLMDILEDCQSCFFYDGCLIAEVRDYRCCHVDTMAHRKHFLLLRPTNQTLISAVEKMSDNLTEDEKVQLESQLLIATENPLCLDPSPNVLAISSRLNEPKGMYNSQQIRRAVKRQSPMAFSRCFHYSRPSALGVIAQCPPEKKLKLLPYTDKRWQPYPEVAESVCLDEVHRQVQFLGGAKLKEEEREFIQEVEALHIDKQGTSYRFIIRRFSHSGHYSITQYKGLGGNYTNIRPMMRSNHEDQDKAEKYLQNLLYADYKGRFINSEDIRVKVAGEKSGFMLNPRWQDGCRLSPVGGMDSQFSRAVRPSEIYMPSPVPVSSSPGFLASGSIAPSMEALSAVNSPSLSSSPFMPSMAGCRPAAVDGRRKSLPTSLKEGPLPLPSSFPAVTAVATAGMKLGRVMNRQQRKPGIVKNRRQTLPLPVGVSASGLQTNYVNVAPVAPVATATTLASSAPQQPAAGKPASTSIQVRPSPSVHHLNIRAGSSQQAVATAAVTAVPTAVQQQRFPQQMALLSSTARPATTVTMTTSTTQALTSPRNQRSLHFLPHQQSQPVFIQPSNIGSSSASNGGGAGGSGAGKQFSTAQLIPSQQIIVRASQAQQLVQQVPFMPHPIAPNRPRGQRKGAIHKRAQTSLSSAGQPWFVFSSMPNQPFSASQGKVTFVQIQPSQQVGQHVRPAATLVTGQTTTNQQVRATANSGQILPVTQPP